MSGGCLVRAKVRKGPRGLVPSALEQRMLMVTGRRDLRSAPGSQAPA
jgi:hypothetical protein